MAGLIPRPEDVQHQIENEDSGPALYNLVRIGSQSFYVPATSEQPAYELR